MPKKGRPIGKPVSEEQALEYFLARREAQGDYKFSVELMFAEAQSKAYVDIGGKHVGKLRNISWKTFQLRHGERSCSGGGRRAKENQWGAPYEEEKNT